MTLTTGFPVAPSPPDETTEAFSRSSRTCERIQFLPVKKQVLVNVEILRHLSPPHPTDISLALLYVDLVSYEDTQHRLHAFSETLGADAVCPRVDVVD